MSKELKIGSALKSFFALAVCSALFVGCNGGPPEFKGTVSWNGKPIEQGYIEFTPVDGEGQIVGTTIVDGEFSMRCAPGKKRVSVRATRKVGMKPANERMPEEPIMHQYLPAEFNSKSKLTKELDTSEPEFSLELEGEELEYTPREMPQGRKDNY